MLYLHVAMSRRICELYILVVIVVFPNFWRLICADEQAGGEVVTCYHSGFRMHPDKIMESIHSFCQKYDGAYFYSGRKVHEQYHNTRFIVPPDGVLDIYAEAIHGCSWYMELNNCERLLLRPRDECITRDDIQKQGGYVTDYCLKFTLDPNRG